MKKLSITIALISLLGLEAQKITSKNSWLKIGVTTGIPVGDIHKEANTDFRLGLELRGQIISTKHIGLGIATAYNHYFVKDDEDTTIKEEDFGTIPLAGFIRVYPKSKGIFLGANVGYSFITNVDDVNGGFYVKPELGYHNYNWNFYGFYEHTFTSDIPDIQSIGLGATYNLRFK